MFSLWQSNICPNDVLFHVKQTAENCNKHQKCLQNVDKAASVEG